MTTTRKPPTHAARAAAALPLTLAEHALQLEQARHANRLAELKGMEAKLRMLDAYMPAIRAAGINIYGDELLSWGGKTIHVLTTLNPQRNATLERVLRECGMREVHRTDYSTIYSVGLSKGHLTVAMSVDKRLPQVAMAQGATKCE